MGRASSISAAALKPPWPNYAHAHSPARSPNRSYVYFSGCASLRPSIIVTANNHFVDHTANCFTHFCIGEAWNRRPGSRHLAN